MADFEYTELEGNGSILKAVEYLRMLPEWKAKPGKFRSGHIEYCQLVARHLVNLYCKLEGKPLTEKIELDAALDPLENDRMAEAKLSNINGTLKAYTDDLNAWHLQLAMLMDIIGHVFDELEDVPDWMISTSALCKERLLHLVETCPFPKADQIVA